MLFRGTLINLHRYFDHIHPNGETEWIDIGISVWASMLEDVQKNTGKYSMYKTHKPAEEGKEGKIHLNGC